MSAWWVLGGIVLVFMWVWIVGVEILYGLYRKEYDLRRRIEAEIKRRGTS